MKNLCLAVALMMSSQIAFASPTVVYGSDNRKDVYLSTNAAHKKLAQSTAAMIAGNSFIRSAKENFFNVESQTLEVAQNVCPAERFSQQPAAASCSGFLVGEDTIVTAGHCYRFADPDQICKGFAWVFDFNMKSASSQPNKEIPLSNIYLCKKVVSATLNSSHDFAIIKLDRKVVGREPLKFRTSGKAADATKLVVIGNPTGLPTKITDGGKILNNIDANTFLTNLDTFQGNSGSAVFDATTGMIEGILIEGKTDYLPSQYSNPNSCMVVNKCDENGKNCTVKPTFGRPEPAGEKVYRITNIAAQLQAAIKAK